MQVLLFGANGQLGNACQTIFAERGIALTALTRAEADFAHPEQVAEALKNHPADLVINACAYTAVDKAESEPELAQRVNGESVGVLAKACAERNIPLFHVSTDYVFDGQGGAASGRAQTPYRETDPVAPMGVYGATKLAGEVAVQQAGDKHMILRTSWVFAEHGNNFVKTMLRLGLTRPELGVVADQRGCPTYAGDIATTLAELAERYQQQGSLPWGIYHCSNQGECSWYDFACAIFSEAVEQGLLPAAPKVNAITTAQYPTPAARPAYSVLDTQKLTRLLGHPLPHWQNSLHNMLRDPAMHRWLDGLRNPS